MPTITEKILMKHLIEEEKKEASSLAIHIDQTLTQDATGTMAYLQLEAMGVDQVKTDLSVSYVDHNTLQNGFENADDHQYLQSVAMKHGIIFSRVGNGICHQVHLERFAKPNTTLLGSDSHTPTAGAMGCLAIGAGGLDVACAMAGFPFHLNKPKIVQIQLHGQLHHGVSAKDIILKLLQLQSVKGGVGCILEYAGDGVKHLSIPQRATLANMGAELGATSSIFPSDERTKEFLLKQNRIEDFVELSADEDAHYDQVIEIDLDQLEPMIALPHSPDHVVPLKEVLGLKVDQVLIGSCTNSSYIDMMTVANILKGKTIAPHLSLGISFGSRQVLQALSKNEGLSQMIGAGARILECTCGPCIGMGQAPMSEGLSIRTFNRNFYGRSGTLSAKVCLVSPETAAASAIAGYLVDPTTLDYEIPQEPDFYEVDDSMFIYPDHKKEIEIIRGPNIKPLPLNASLPECLNKKVIIKVKDDITTDHIAPAGAKVLPYRSNIEKLSQFIFMNVKENFYEECLTHHGGIIVAGSNYGQGSSREHAALAPMYLGIKAVIAKSFARIHRANLINFGILPLTFMNEMDYEQIDEYDELHLDHLHDLQVDKPLLVYNATKNCSFYVKHSLTQKDIQIILAGGMLNYIFNSQNNS